MRYTALTVNAFTPTASCSITSVLVSKSGGGDLNLVRPFILMTGNGRPAILIVLSRVRLVSSWSCAYAKAMEVIAGFLARCNPVRDDKGQITRWYVAATDIEERKQAEERLRDENIALREEISKASMFEEIVGASPALQTVLSRISKVAPAASTVLITGETGTGKELVARAIHRRSKRSSRPFVSVNCAAIPRDLIASELFGHEKGAFTGALQRRSGQV